MPWLRSRSRNESEVFGWSGIPKNASCRIFLADDSGFNRQNELLLLVNIPQINR